MAELTDTSGQEGLPRWFKTVFAIARQVEQGALVFEMPDGRVFSANGAKPGPTGRVIVRDPRLFWRMIRHGEMGFAEAYMDGWWDTPDLQMVLDVALMNNDAVARGYTGSVLVRLVERLRHLTRRNTRRGSRRNISHHYDLGNRFYETWLDETMTYSSALFEAKEQDLAKAQQAKYRSICDRMGVQSGQHVLEIGCGWGGFAEYAAKERDARVTGLTISREQHDYARERIFREGLGEKVEIALRDYRDETGVYDGIASIEMFEAVGEKYWPAYFDTVRARLNPGAIASLQIITIADQLFDTYRQSVDFVQKYIFPGGMLPSPSALREEVSRAGLEWGGMLEFGDSYSETLRRWRRDFHNRWDDIRPLGFDERFRRMWDFYLASCAACFLAETTNVVQLSLRRAT